MPGWYFSKKELKNTPSIMKGLDYKTEMRYRKEGAQFIISVGKEMKLGYNTTATGVVYFHRFYMFHSFQEFPKYVTACCCILLAGKVEETPKKCRDIIEKAKNLLSDHKFATFGIDPKEEVVTLERVLLQTIKFDLQVEHPYQFLLKYAKYLKGDKAKLEKMVQMAWTFVNDSLCTTLCLQWEPEIIAVALMYLAGKLSKFEVLDWSGRNPKHLRWWDMFVEDMTMDLLEDICHQVLDLYSQPASGEGKSPSPPPAQALKGAKLTPPKQGGALPPSDKQPLPQPLDVTMMPPPPLNNPKLPQPPQPPPMNEVPPLQYQTFTHAPPLPMAPYGNAAVRFPAGVVATAVNTPPPPMGGPPPPPNVFAPFVGHPPPPPFSAVVPPPPAGAPPYFGSGGMPPPPPGPMPPHRPFYQSQ